MTVTPIRSKTWLDRTLSLVTDVRAGEGLSALLLALNVFTLLGFYYVLKTIRDSLILAEGGAKVASYSAAGQALLLVFLVPAYGKFASKVSRVRLISWVMLFFASHLLVFYSLGVSGVHVGIPFFLWAGIFNLMVIAQFWAFANDLFTEEKGKRLFPLIGVGASLGAWVGAQIAGRVFAGVGPYRLMLVAAAGLVASIVLTLWVDRRERERAVDREGEKKPPPPLGGKGGFQLVLQERYLLLIAMLVLVLNIVNTTGEFLLNTMIAEHATAQVAADGVARTEQEVTEARTAIIGTFKGQFFGWVNLLGFLFQLLLVPKLFKYIGVRGALFVLPCVAFVSYGMMATLPILSIVSLAKVLENSTDYSVQNTTRQALFLPTSREAKYKAKQAIDSFFWRAGDLLQAVVVFIGLRMALGVRGFALVNLVLVIVWIGIAIAIGKEYRLRTREGEQEAAA